MLRIFCLLFLSILCVCGAGRNYRPLIGYTNSLASSGGGGGGGGAAFVNPTNLTGNLHLLTPEALGIQSDGAALDLTRRWTNDVNATGAPLYSYGTILITNNVQNGKAGLWAGSGANSIIQLENTISLSNYMMVTTARIDSEQVGDNIIVDFIGSSGGGGDAMRLVIDPTRTNYMTLKVQIGLDSSYRFTNAFTRGTAFTFGVWRQGTNLVAWREYGQVGATNAIDPQINAAANYALFGNGQTGTQRPIGFQFDFLMNTNSALNGTNLPAVVYFHTNKYGIF